MRIDHLGIDESVGEIFPPSVLADYLADLPIDVSVVDGSPAELARCDGVVSLYHRDAFIEHVDWIQSIQAGVDRFPFDALRDAGVVLTNSSGIHRDSVGETVVGYITMFARRLHIAVANKEAATWDRPGWDEPFTLTGKSLCVIGLGALGQGVAERAQSLGMHVTGIRRTPEPLEVVDELYQPDDLHDAIEESRFVVLAVPLTDETHHLIDKEALDTMRSDAYLVNVARGQVVDEPALISALQNDVIAGAGLDVFAEEPLPSDSPLWDLDNVIITPHQAGSWEGYYRAVGDLVKENVTRQSTDDAWVNRVV